MTWREGTILTVVFLIVTTALVNFVSCDRYSTCMHAAKDVAACGKP